MSDIRISADQLHIAQMLNQQPFEAERRLRAFAVGRLQIWCNAVERQDSAGNVHTLARAAWVEVTEAEAIFVRDAKYRIVKGWEHDEESD